MKKYLKAAALILVLALLLCTTAFAVDALDSESNSVSFVTEGDNSYQVMNVSFTNDKIQDGKDYMIWVIAGTEDDAGERVYIPTSSSILYIGQGTASGTTFTFNGVFPKEIANAAVVISGPGMVEIDPDGDGLYTLATIYESGDVDLNGTVDVGDAIKLLQSLVGLTDFNDLQNIVANTNGNDAVDVGDAIDLLQYLVGIVDDI